MSIPADATPRSLNSNVLVQFDEQLRNTSRGHLCRNISVDISRHEVACGHCDRRPRHCCMSHSDELPSANTVSALQHHLSGTLSLSPFRTVTCLHYLNLDLKHICFPPSMFLNCPVRQHLCSHMALYKFCIVLYCMIQYKTMILCAANGWFLSDRFAKTVLRIDGELRWEEFVEQVSFKPSIKAREWELRVKN